MIHRMMRATAAAALLLASNTVPVAGQTQADGASSTRAVGDTAVSAADAFLATLTPAQRKAAVFAFDDAAQV